MMSTVSCYPTNRIVRKTRKSSDYGVVPPLRSVAIRRQNDILRVGRNATQESMQSLLGLILMQSLMLQEGDSLDEGFSSLYPLQ